MYVIVTNVCIWARKWYLPGNVSLNVFNQKLPLWMYSSKGCVAIYKIETISIGLGRCHDGCSKTTRGWLQSNRRDCPLPSISADDQCTIACLQKNDCIAVKVWIGAYVTELSIMERVAVSHCSVGLPYKCPVTWPGLCSLIGDRAGPVVQLTRSR